MKNQMHRLPQLLLASLLVAFGVSWLSAKDNNENTEKARKADYIFLEAQNAYLNDQYDRYFQLVRRAYELDSTDADIAGEWAIVTMMDESTDNAAASRAYRNLQQRFLKNPTNYYSGVMFANVAMQEGRFDDAIATWQMIDSLFPKRSEPSQELAKAYFNKYMAGDSAAFDKAMAIYNQLESGTGKNISTISLKTKAYSLRGDTLAIIHELEALDSIAPNDSYSSLWIALHYEYLNHPDLALKYYDKACALDSTNGSAFAARADYYRTRGDSVAYDREVFHALRSQNLEVENKIGILRSYVAGLYSKPSEEPRIRQLFNDLEVMHPGETDIHRLFASYLYLRNDYKGAAEQYSYATALAPNDEDTRTSYIQILLMAGDTIAALDNARIAREKFPQNLYYPLLMSYTYRDMGDTALAIGVLDSVKIEQVLNSQAVGKFLAAKGDILAAVGDTARALSTYDEAIAIDPSNSMALNNAAYFIAVSGGDLDKAERYSVRSLKGDELNPTYLDTYAWVLFKKKSYTLAKLYIDIALNAFNDALPTDTTSTDSASVDEVDIDAPDVEYDAGASADIYDHAGDIYFMNGEVEKALEFWEKALKLDPQNELINKKVTHKTIFLQ